MKLGETLSRFVPERLKSRAKSPILEQVIRAAREKGIKDFVKIEPSYWLSHDDAGRSVQAYGMVVQFDTNAGKEVRFGRTNEVSSSHIFDSELNLRNVLTAVKLQEQLAGQGISSKIVDRLIIEELPNGKARFVPVIMESSQVDGLVKQALEKDLKPFPLAQPAS